MKALYKHFVAATSVHRMPLKQAHMEEPFNHEDLQHKVYEKSVQDKEEINPLFVGYCTELE